VISMKRLLFAGLIIVLLFLGMVYRNLQLHQNEIDFKRHVASELGIHSDSTIVEMMENIKRIEYLNRIASLEEEFISNKNSYTLNARDRGADMFMSFDIMIDVPSEWDSMTTKEKSVYLVELHGVKVYLVNE